MKENWKSAPWKSLAMSLCLAVVSEQICVNFKIYMLAFYLNRVAWKLLLKNSMQFRRPASLINLGLAGDVGTTADPGTPVIQLGCLFHWSLFQNALQAGIFMALSLPLAAKSGVMLTNWRTAQRWEEWKTADEENQWIRSHVPTLMVSPFHHMEALQIVKDLRLIILKALGFMLLRPG